MPQNNEVYCSSYAEHHLKYRQVLYTANFAIRSGPGTEKRLLIGPI